MRGVPDVSFDVNPNTGVSVYDSTADDSQSGWFTLGGTSVGTPNWAGILAVGDGSAGPLEGAQKIYGGGYESYLRDITGGTNGSCGTDCTAGTGYDLVTGLGSPISYPVLADPSGGVTPVPPHFYNGNVEGIRDSGLDTTFFMMQRIGDLYTGAGLYGCTLNSSAGQTLYNSSDPASATANEEYYCQSGQNISTTDVNDNWDRTEVTEGVDDVGSGAGQNQLCAALSTPLPVDFARSSKPSTGVCSTEVQTGYAKDGVPILTYPVNPTTYGTSTTAPYSSINGGVVGPVALGWLPGDPNGGPYTGTALTNLSNADNGGAASSTAYRMWCATDATRITDWGALINLGPDLEVQGLSVSSGSTTATISGTFPSTVASGDAITGTDIPSSTTVSSVSGGTLTLSNPASGTATVTVRITTASAPARRPGHADRRAAAAHGRQHGLGHRSHLRQLRRVGGLQRWVFVEHEHQRRQRSQPGHRHGRQRDPPRRVGEQLGPARPVRHNRLPVAGLRRPGHRGGDDAVHRVQRCVQHEPIRGGLDHRRHLLHRVSR